MEVYFRIPDLSIGSNRENLDVFLKKIGLIFVGGGSVDRSPIFSEKDASDKITYEGRTLIMKKESGYQYSISSSNDHKIGEIYPEHNIFCLHYRYGQEKTMRDICRGICAILNLQYIEDLILVSLILGDFYGDKAISKYLNSSPELTIGSKDYVFDQIIDVIEKQTTGLKLQPNEFKNEAIRKYIHQKFKQDNPGLYC